MYTSRLLQDIKHSDCSELHQAPYGMWSHMTAYCFYKIEAKFKLCLSCSLQCLASFTLLILCSCHKKTYLLSHCVSEKWAFCTCFTPPQLYKSFIFVAPFSKSVLISVALLTDLFCVLSAPKERSASPSSNQKRTDRL